MIEKLNNRLQVLILQHPQEPDKELGSAKLAETLLAQCKLKVGLSWPNLKAALAVKGEPASDGVPPQPGRWVVLYLGSGVKTAVPSRAHPLSRPTLQFVTKQGAPAPAPELDSLDGIVVLDGTWSQAKALWWRNAWLLKLKRAVLNPKQKSLYGSMRKEPRRECLSTIESIAEGLVALGESAELGDQLRDGFKKFLARPSN